MFTTLEIDELSKKIDVMVKVKKFKTQAEGKFIMILLTEIELDTKKPSGKFALMKVSN
jgi:hypothetical protein